MKNTAILLAGNPFVKSNSIINAYESSNIGRSNIPSRIIDYEVEERLDTTENNIHDTIPSSMTSSIRPSSSISSLPLLSRTSSALSLNSESGYTTTTPKQMPTGYSTPFQNTLSNYLTLSDTVIVPSLLELCARTILLHDIPVSPHQINRSLLSYLHAGGRPCGQCKGPIVNEWMCGVRVCGYVGTPVTRAVRYCSAKCLKENNSGTCQDETLPNGKHRWLCRRASLLSGVDREYDDCGKLSDEKYDW